MIHEPCSDSNDNDIVKSKNWLKCYTEKMSIMRHMSFHCIKLIYQGKTWNWKFLTKLKISNKLPATSNKISNEINNEFVSKLVKEGISTAFLTLKISNEKASHRAFAGRSFSEDIWYVYVEISSS